MEAIVGDLVKRPLYGELSVLSQLLDLKLMSKVFDLPKDILSTLQPKNTTTSLIQSDVEATVQPTDDGGIYVQKDGGSPGSKSCAMCRVVFDSVLSQRSHIKSDFHRYNLKLKMKGLKPVSEADFEKLVGGR